jgi:hypothetical protein
VRYDEGAQPVTDETLLALFRIVVGTATLAFFGAWAVRRGTFLVQLVLAAKPNPERNIRTPSGPTCVTRWSTSSGTRSC